MKLKKQDEKIPGWIIKQRAITPCDPAHGFRVGGPQFEVVGDKLVDATLIDSLIEHIEGKRITTPFVLSIPDLLDGDFMGYLLDEQKMVVGDCLLMLLNTGRIDLVDEEI